MIDLSRALARAFASLMHPKMLLLMIGPIAAALALWIGLAVFFWGDVWGWISPSLGRAESYLSDALKWILLLLLMVPLTLITATLIIGFTAMPLMVKHVSTRDYPRLELRRGGTFTGSLWNVLVSLTLLIVLAFVTLPLWLIPPLWPLLPVALFGYFNERVFRYDALAEHADGVELKRVIGGNRGKLLALGLIVAVLGFVPLAGFFVPVFGGLVFIHFCLDKLAALRGTAT